MKMFRQLLARCRDDYRRRNGRLEPLRCFLVPELVVAVLGAVASVAAVAYLATPLPTEAGQLVAVHFNEEGCGDEFQPSSVAVPAMQATALIPASLFLALYGIAILTRSVPRCLFCVSFPCGWSTAAADMSTTEKFKIRRAYFTMLCMLAGGANILLAPILSFGRSSNAVCVKNATCRAAAAAAAVGNQSAPSFVCCADYAASPAEDCNSFLNLILFSVGLGLLPLVTTGAFCCAMREKLRRGGNDPAHLNQSRF